MSWVRQVSFSFKLQEKRIHWWRSRPLCESMFDYLLSGLDTSLSPALAPLISGCSLWYQMPLLFLTAPPRAIFPLLAKLNFRWCWTCCSWSSINMYKQHCDIWNLCGTNDHTGTKLITPTCNDCQVVPPNSYASYISLKINLLKRKETQKVSSHQHLYTSSIQYLFLIG